MFVWNEFGRIVNGLRRDTYTHTHDCVLLGYIRTYKNDTERKSVLSYYYSTHDRAFTFRFITGGTIAYYSHTGVPLVRYYDSGESGHLTYDGVSTYRQWIYLIFLHYKMVNEEYVMASVGGGVMFSKMNETMSSTKYDYYSEGHANDIKGGIYQRRIGIADSRSALLSRE